MAGHRNVPQNHYLAMKCTCKIHYWLVCKPTVTISKLVLLVYNPTPHLHTSLSLHWQEKVALFYQLSVGYCTPVSFPGP